MFKVNKKDIRTTSLTFVNFEHISHFALVFLLLSLSRQMSTGKYSGKMRHTLKRYQTTNGAF